MKKIRMMVIDECGALCCVAVENIPFENRTLSDEQLEMIKSIFYANHVDDYGPEAQAKWVETDYITKDEAEREAEAEEQEINSIMEEFDIDFEEAQEIYYEDKQSMYW